MPTSPTTRFARDLLVRARLAQGEPEAAERERVSAAQQVIAPARGTDSGWFELTAVRVMAARGLSADARRRGEALRERARQLGDQRLVFESELLLGELERNGDPAAGSRRLLALVSAARAVGHERIARRAEAFASGSRPGRGR